MILLIVLVAVAFCVLTVAVMFRRREPSHRMLRLPGHRNLRMDLHPPGEDLTL